MFKLCPVKIVALDCGPHLQRPQAYDLIFCIRSLPSIPTTASVLAHPRRRTQFPLLCAPKKVSSSLRVRAVLRRRSPASSWSGPAAAQTEQSGSSSVVESRRFGPTLVYGARHRGGCEWCGGGEPEIRPRPRPWPPTWRGRMARRRRSHRHPHARRRIRAPSTDPSRMGQRRASEASTPLLFSTRGPASSSPLVAVPLLLRS